MQIALRSALRSDAKYVVDLEEVCMRGYVVALWGKWHLSNTADTLELAGHEIIEVNDQPAGCIAVTWHPDHMFIEKLYIDPAFQGRGVGASAQRSKTDAAARVGLPTKLSVLTTNPADRFYRREGFTLEAETSERRRFSKDVS